MKMTRFTPRCSEALQLLHLLSFGLVFVGCLANDDWSYEGANGIDKWINLKDHNERNQCGGRHQSPVDIAEDRIRYKAIRPLTFHGYGTELRNVTAVLNHGSANIVNVGRGDRFITGGPLDDRYLVFGFHFHWGRRVDSGSEHTFDGRRFPLELHIVHIKAEYRTFENARRHPDGLAVLAVIFEIGNPWQFPVQSRHVATWRQDDAEERLTEIFLALQGRANLTVWKSGLSLVDLLPREPERFYTYQGSLTTPFCNEAVTWIIFQQRVPITKELVERFHRLRDKHGVSFPRNWRPTQPLNGRTIYRNFQNNESFGGSTTEEGTRPPTRHPHRSTSRPNGQSDSVRFPSDKPSSTQGTRFDRPPFGGNRPSSEQTFDGRPPSTNRPFSQPPSFPFDGPLSTGFPFDGPLPTRFPFGGQPSSGFPGFDGAQTQNRPQANRPNRFGNPDNGQQPQGNPFGFGF